MERRSLLLLTHKNVPYIRHYDHCGVRHSQRNVMVWKQQLKRRGFGFCRHSMKADIYSFGITLLEMACGRVPFAGMPFQVVAMHKMHHAPPTLPSSHDGRHYSSVGCTSLQHPSSEILHMLFIPPFRE